MYRELEKVPVPSLLSPSYCLYVDAGIQLLWIMGALDIQNNKSFSPIFSKFIGEFYQYYTPCFWISFTQRNKSFVF